MTSPDDVAYVTAGFAPIIARLVENIGSVNWTNDQFSDTIKMLSGPLVEIKQVPGAPFEELNDVLAR